MLPTVVMATLPFVGRELELASLRETCAAAGTAVVIGAAGLGKSRLVAELSTDESLTCVVAVGAVELQTSPYAVFRTLALQWGRLLDPCSLGWADSQLLDLGPVFPALQPNGRPEDPTTGEQRQGLWLSLLRYLDALVASQTRPLALVIEDLHAVDASSLRLFAWLASQPLGMAMIATARPEAIDLVAKLPTIGLQPLGLTSIETIQRKTDATAIDPETLLELTGGIPLRVHEWLLTSSFNGSMHLHDALLDRLLDGCSSSTRTAVHLAAVFSGRIDSHLLASALAEPESTAMQALADVASRGIMTHNRDGTWTFDHDSYRISLLDGLDHQQRRSCERQLLDGLREQLVARPELLAPLAAIATRLGENRVEAAELHLAAGRHALHQRAPLLARDHFEAAVALSEPTSHRDLALQSILALGLVLAELSDVGANAVLAKVYPLADVVGDGNAFALAALAELTGLGHIGAPMMTNHLVAARLRSASTKGTNQTLRARVLAELAVQQHSSLDEREYFALIDEAGQIADEVADPVLDAQILAARVGIRRKVGDTTDLDSEIHRHLDLLAPFDPNALPMVDLAVMAACRSGDLSAAENLIRRYENEFAPLPLIAQWSILRARTAIAFARGSLEMARSLSLEALQITKDTRLDAVAIEHFAFQIAAMLRERRKAADARPTIETWVAEHPSYAAFRASRAWLYADLGEVSLARSDLEVFFAQDLVELRSRVAGPVSISMALSAAFIVGGNQVQKWCRQGHELLLPLADEWLLVGQSSLIEGPVVRVLALASSAAGETERALTENAEAQRRAQESGALLFLWHALRDRGLILRNAGRFDEARQALSEAVDRYRSAGLTEQADWLATLLTNMGPSEPAGSMVAGVMGVFRKDHKVWHVGLADEAAICRHLKGMAMIATLLGAPNRLVAAGVLAAIGDGTLLAPEHAAARAASTQPLLDDEAVAAYRRRLDEIVIELDRADRRGDAATSSRFTVEFDAITAELASTHGLGGRRRAMTTDDERARVRVNKAIRSAIRRVGEQAPALALHLDRSIDTGLFCSYRTGPLRQVDWMLS